MRKYLTNISERVRSLPIVWAYIFCYLLLFVSARQGIGMFWDWNWPIFESDLGSIFLNQSHSWTDQLLGQPMVYNPSYYSNYLLSIFKHTGLQPETALYFFLTLTTAATSFGVYLIARKKLNYGAAFLFGLLVILNPAYFYKLTAGHLSYLISMAIFVYFIYFLFYKFKYNFRSALVLGLFFAFVGAQIQFFAFAFIVLIVFYIANYKAFKIKYLLAIFSLAFLVNLPWLSNFLVGAIQMSEISGQAGNIAFDGATKTSLLRIATLSFSDATLLKYFYPKYIFAFFGLFSLGIFALTGWKIARIISQRQRLSREEVKLSNDQKVEKPDSVILQKSTNHLREFWVVLICLGIFIFLGTGIYQNWNIPLIKTLYPMLRESGHFAPIIVLFMALLLIRVWSEKKWIKRPLMIYLIIFALINAYTIFQSLPTVNYASLRARLSPYKEFLDQDRSTYRIAAYPFFGQYSVAEEQSKEVRGQPVRNTGIDVFTQNSVYEALSNYIPAQQLDQSVQYKFLKTLDLGLLEDRNIKYLLDFSEIYQSNVEKYSDPSYYDNNLSLIKNDPTLFRRLLAEYPTRLVEVSPNIYELTESTKRVEAEGRDIEIAKVSPSLYQVKISNFADNTKLDFNTSFHKDWKIFMAGQEIATDSHVKSENFGQSWMLKYPEIKQKSREIGLKINDDNSIDLELVIYFLPEKYFKVALMISLLTLLASTYLIIRISRRKAWPLKE